MINKRKTLFSERVKELRNKKSMTQSDLAKKLGFYRATIGDWETRGKEPSFSTLCELAKTFNVTVDYILGINEN